MSTLHSILLASMISADTGQAAWSPPDASPPLWHQIAAEDAHAALEHARAHTLGALDELDIVGQVHTRVKSVESLRAKARRKGLPETAVLDRLGLRVIVQDEGDCYTVRDALVALFPVVPGTEDDYIAHPKANGYQSLHVALLAGPRGEAVEVQIRSAAMHDHAEHGGASHRDYKAAQAAAAA